ncbi:heparinase [Marinifilum sp. JC120]|nr:heparinase [Marinifilum sp. JC120]
MSMERIVWLFNRLRAMGPVEIMRRCIDEGVSFMQSRGLMLAADSPLFFSDNSLLHVPEFDSQERDLEDVLRIADKLIDDGMDVFTLSGVECVNPEWNRDPLTGIEAPLYFAKKLNVKDIKLCVNIKYLWEPGRFLQAVPFALAWKISGEIKYLRAVKGMLESWLNQCPYLMGVHWASPLELGLRLINWSIVWQYVGGFDSPMFEGEEGRVLRDCWLQSIYQHIHYIDGCYSYGSSANNHLIGEAAGVFIACCTWPFEDDYDRWKSRALGILEDEVHNQVWPDGVNKEQTLAYQQFVYDLLSLSYLFDPICFSTNYCDVLKKMNVFIAAMSDGSGNSPMIGDADDGRVCGLSLLPQGVPQVFTPSGGQPDSFPDGGYHILRDDRADLFMVIDSGPLGYGTLAAHGHADALAIYLTLDGHEFLIDPGTYVYGSDPFWREYFRGTSAHNTVRLDGMNQSESGGNFLWNTHAQTYGKVERGQSEDVFQGSHDGYQRLADPVTHSRQVLLNREERQISVRDGFSCCGEHLAEQFWHFSEECRAELLSDNMVQVENAGIRISMTFGPNVRLELFKGDEQIPLGWVSRRFGVKVKAVTLVATAEVEGDTVLSTEIFY